MANFLHSPCDHVATPTSTPSLSKRSEKWVLTATILGSSMAFIDGTVVNVALPALQEALHASVSQIQWVMEIYVLTLAAFLLVGGALGDLYGRRFIFLIGVFVFAAASIWCGLASTISQLIMARAMQGVGAALLVPGSLALISASFSEEGRGKAIGTWSGFTAITTAIGPVLGGWLIQNASWRWIFFLNIPLAVIVFIVTMIWVSESRNEHKRHGLDILGALLAVIGLGAIVFGLIEWEHNNISTIFLIEILGVGAMLGFYFVEAHASSPMVTLEMFQSRNFSVANLITFFLYFSLIGWLFFFPLNLIQVQRYTATQAGAALLPLILLMFLLSRWAGGLIKRFGPRLPLMVGPAIAAFGFALFHTSVKDTYWTSSFLATIVLGLGMAVSVAPLTTVVMSSVKQDHLGAASGINNAVSRVAGLLAIAIFGVIMIKIFNQQLVQNLQASSIPIDIQQEVINQRSKLADINIDNVVAQQIVRESFIAGYNVIVWLATILAMLSCFSAMFLIANKKKN